MKKTAHDLLDDMRYSTVKLTVERNYGVESEGTGFFFDPEQGDANLLLIKDRGDRSVSRGGMRGQVELLRAA